MLQIIKNFPEAKNKIIQVANRLNNTGSQRSSVDEAVGQILQEFLEAKNKTQKVFELTERFDKQKISELAVSTQGCFAKLPPQEQSAIKLASQRIREFHQQCLPANICWKDKSQAGSQDQVSVLFQPIDSVGLYIPGGSAPLLSTLMMTAIPAQVAGVKRLMVCSPPQIHHYILAVADYLEIPFINQIGGVQAIASMAYGLEDNNFGFEAVDKIFGPGNQYVTAAKKMVLGTVGIDALYGPSELLIIADENAKPMALASDLMSQLEHGSGFESACLLTNSLELAQATLQEFENILLNQPRRELIEKAWQQFGIVAVLDSIEQCIELSNLFAPEHLELKTTNYAELLKHISNAGAVFVGASNEAIGDYLAGPSHCLPTGRSARFSSGLSVMDFMKRINVVDINPSKELLEATALLARMEGLEAHAQAALKCLK